jgi:hypothetical protein
MSFKQNLLKKIQIDRMTQRVLASIGVTDGSRKIDRSAMKWLLEVAGYVHRQVRDLDMFMSPRTEAAGHGDILVLDNELKFYRSTLDDVAMRKSPLIKEMVNVRNAFKILNDKDVALTRKEATVERLRDECIATLDLSFGPEDLALIAADGKTALEKEQNDGVIESLDLFGELLGYLSPPKAFQLSRHHIICARGEGADGVVVYGPLVVYNLLHNTLRLIDMQLQTAERQKIEAYERIVGGKEKAALEGPEVFDFLKEKVTVYPLAPPLRL